MLKGNRDWEGWYLEGLETFFRDIHPILFAVTRRRDPKTFAWDEVFKSSMFPLQRVQELREMLKLSYRLSRPEVVMEIGADKGGGLYHWCLLPNVRKVVAVEIGGIPYDDYFEKAFPSIEFLWIPASSYDRNTVLDVRNFLEEDKIDALFIDGDKTAFARDFRTYRPMLSSRSIAFLHDTYDDGPRQDFETLAKDYPSVRLINTESSVRAVVDEVLGKEPEGVHEGWLRTWKGNSAGVGVLFTGKDYYNGKGK